MKLYIVVKNMIEGAEIEGVYLDPSIAETLRSALEDKHFGEFHYQGVVVVEKEVPVRLAITHGGTTNLYPLTDTFLKSVMDSYNMHGHQNTGCGPDSVRIVDAP